MVRTVVAILLTVVTLLLLLVLYGLFASGRPAPAGPTMAYSDFRRDVDAGKVKTVTIEGALLLGVLTDNRRFQAYAPDDPTLVASLLAKDVQVLARPSAEPSFLHLVLSWLPLLLFTAAWAWGFSRIARSLRLIDATLRMMAEPPPRPILPHQSFE